MISAGTRPYHDEGHHPHVHMMAWSAEPKKGYLTREGIAVMRSRMTNAIFHEEMKELYIKKDAAYKESIQTAKESLLLYIRMLENSESADPVIEQKLCDLPHALEQVDGKHVYGYLPKEIKAQVDEIVEQLAQLPEVAACYEQWWKLKDEIASYYGRNTPSHQPLVQQKEFRAIKNMIIQQAETFRQPVSEQVPVETEPNEQQVPPSTESACGYGTAAGGRVTERNRGRRGQSTTPPHESCVPRQYAGHSACAAYRLQAPQTVTGEAYGHGAQAGRP